MRSQYRKLGLVLILCIGLLMSPAVFAQNRGFTGKVTNDKGEPVINAKVAITGISSKRVYNTNTNICLGGSITLWSGQRATIRASSRRMRQSDCLPLK
jgi:hypothetical protein